MDCNQKDRLWQTLGVIALVDGGCGGMFFHGVWYRCFFGNDSIGEKHCWPLWIHTWLEMANGHHVRIGIHWQHQLYYFAL